MRTPYTGVASGFAGEEEAMCGIVGLYLKNPALRPHPSRLFAPMMAEITERGPDSAGF